MALPSCKRCGKQNPERMHGLMTLWFGPLVELDADLGYFYLCPGCHDQFIVPELERIQNRILELHPAAQRQLDELDVTSAPPAGDEASDAEPPDPEAPDPEATDAEATDAEATDAGGGGS